MSLTGASTSFLVDHFGFLEEMAADGLASLSREDAGMNVVFLRRGLETLPADQRDEHARGVVPSWSMTSKETSRGCSARASRSPSRSPRKSGVNARSR